MYQSPRTVLVDQATFLREVYDRKKALYSRFAVYLEELFDSASTTDELLLWDLGQALGAAMNHDLLANVQEQNYIRRRLRLNSATVAQVQAENDRVADEVEADIRKNEAAEASSED